MQHRINPMGWARIPAEKGNFTEDTEFNSFELNLASSLSRIFVEQMGLARRISLAVDPQTGGKVMEFLIDRDSLMAEKLVEHEISGIPIRFAFSS